MVCPALARLRQKDRDLKVRLGYIASSRPDWTAKQSYELKNKLLNTKVFVPCAQSQRQALTELSHNIYGPVLGVLAAHCVPYL